MGNACSQCFEGLIKSLDKYENESDKNDRNKQRTGEETIPLLKKQNTRVYDSNGLATNGATKSITKKSNNTNRNSKSLPKEQENTQAVIDEISEKIRKKMIENLQSVLPQTNESPNDQEHIKQEITRCGSNHPHLTTVNTTSSDMTATALDNSNHSNNSDPSTSNHGLKQSFDLPPEFLKLYDIGRLVGIGTTAKVYQITRRNRKYITTTNPNNNNKSKSENNNNQHHHQQPLLLACKVIDKRKLTLQMNYTEMEPLLIQLRREVDILRRINHPNIVTYYDFMETKHQIFIITEYLTGGELFDYLANYGSIPEIMCKYLIYDLFDAIAYLHEHKIIHRDIKAENCIFYLNHSNEIAIKLIDFGFSINIQASYMTSSFLGTFGYIAPEISQNRYYNVSVDNWALGILLYCMISAKMPFKLTLHPSDLETPPADSSNNSASTSSSDVKNKVQMALQLTQKMYKLQFPDKQWKHISAECKDLISELLQIDPMKRMTSKNALHHPWFRGIKELKRANAKKFRASQMKSSQATAKPASTTSSTAVSTAPSIVSVKATDPAKPLRNSAVKASPASSNPHHNPFAAVSFAGTSKKKSRKLSFDSYHDITGKKNPFLFPSTYTLQAPPAATKPATTEMVAQSIKASMSLSLSPSNSFLSFEPHTSFDDENITERLYRKSNRLRRSQSTLNLERRTNPIASPPLPPPTSANSFYISPRGDSGSPPASSTTTNTTTTNSSAEKENKKSSSRPSAFNESNVIDEDQNDDHLFFLSMDSIDDLPLEKQEKEQSAKIAAVVPKLQIPTPSRSSPAYLSLEPLQEESTLMHEDSGSIDVVLTARSENDVMAIMKERDEEVAGKWSNLSTSMQDSLMHVSVETRQHSFIWEEIHDKIAGDLFYSTYIPIHAHYR